MKTAFIRAFVLIFALIPHICATASDFEADGVYYNILSEEDRTVEVTHKSNHSDENENYVSGEMEIPRKVLYNKKTYTVTSIGMWAFCQCTGLTSVTIPNSVTSIGDCAFFRCSGLTSMTIPNSVTSVGETAFGSCTGLTSVMIPNSVTSIGDWAFRICTGLASVTIGKSVTSIGNLAFLGCSSLSSVTIPNSVTSIGRGAFDKCWGLQTIYVQSRVPVECAPNFPDDVIKNAILYVPTGTLAAYEKVDPWRNFWNIEEMDFSGIEDAEMDATRSADEPVIRVENGVIKVDNADGEAPVEVFDILGKSVFRECANIVSGLAKGIYIVKVGDKVQKIRL